MVRTAKLSGNGACLFPEGTHSIEHLTWDLAQAIEHAVRVCSWQENLMSEDMPPNWMLPFDSELELWFEEVDRRREDRYGGGAEESGSMMENELTKGRFGR
jgi:hypothetical protein